MEALHYFVSFTDLRNRVTDSSTWKGRAGQRCLITIEKQSGRKSFFWLYRRVAMVENNSLRKQSTRFKMIWAQGNKVRHVPTTLSWPWQYCVDILKCHIVLCKCIQLLCIKYTHKQQYNYYASNTHTHGVGGFSVHVLLSLVNE